MDAPANKYLPPGATLPTNSTVVDEALDLTGEAASGAVATVSSVTATTAGVCVCVCVCKRLRAFSSLASPALTG